MLKDFLDLYLSNSVLVPSFGSSKPNFVRLRDKLTSKLLISGKRNAGFVLKIDFV